MNLKLTDKQALTLLIELKKSKVLPLVLREIDHHFKNMEVLNLLKLQDQFETTYTIDFQIECVKCGKDFESSAVSNKSAPKKHIANCPNCKTKHLWTNK